MPSSPALSSSRTMMSLRTSAQPSVRGCLTALRTTPRYLIPPGYVTVPEFRNRISSADVHGSANWDDLVAINRIVAGTPEKVADQIGRWAEEADVSRITLNLALGDMPHWKVVKNLTLFAEEVIPRLRGRTKAAAPVANGAAA